MNVTPRQTFHPKKKYILGLGPGCVLKPKPKPKSIWVWIQNEFYRFWYRNQQTFKIFDTHKFLGLKNVNKNIRKFLENL